MSALRVRVDRELCCGYGVCREICPEVFDVSPGGLVELKLDLAPAGLEVQVRDAAENCPQSCIFVEPAS